MFFLASLGFQYHDQAIFTTLSGHLVILTHAHLDSPRKEDGPGTFPAISCFRNTTSLLESLTICRVLRILHPTPQSCPCVILLTKAWILWHPLLSLYFHAIVTFSILLNSALSHTVSIKAKVQVSSGHVLNCKPLTYP